MLHYAVSQGNVYSIKALTNNKQYKSRKAYKEVITLLKEIDYLYWINDDY